VAVEVDSGARDTALLADAIETEDSPDELDRDESVSAEAEFADDADVPSDDAVDQIDEPAGKARKWSWPRVVAFGLLPALALLLASGAGYLKWRDASARASQLAQTEAVQAASASTVALLSYKPDSVDKDLNAASGRLTGGFKDSYTSLIRDVVIPGAKQKQISAVATVPAAAPVSASGNHAVVVVFVDQMITMGNDAPTNTASTVRVTLDKVGGSWLISKFEPI
jgi:Mce-associated membrane protein